MSTTLEPNWFSQAQNLLGSPANSAGQRMSVNRQRVETFWNQKSLRQCLQYSCAEKKAERSAFISDQSKPEWFSAKFFAAKSHAKNIYKHAWFSYIFIKCLVHVSSSCSLGTREPWIHSAASWELRPRRSKWRKARERPGCRFAKCENQAVQGAAQRTQAASKARLG